MEVVNTVGRRKAAVARVFVKPGKGDITINRKSLEVYFPLDILCGAAVGSLMGWWAFNLFKSVKFSRLYTYS